MTSGFRAIAALAERRGGLVTTAEAQRAGVTLMQLSRMAASGQLIRLAQGVYRAAGAPEPEHETTLVAWLALGGATLDDTATGAPAVVAAGQTASALHHIGDLWPTREEFIVPRRRGTRLHNIKLRVETLAPADVTIAAGVPTLTVERTIADLVAQWADLSLVADVIRDAHQQGKVVFPRRLSEYLNPLAGPNGYPTGEVFLQALSAAAGLPDPTTEPAHR